MYLAKINEILAADVININDRLKQKKAEDQEKKKEQKEKEIEPDFSKATLRVTTSSSFAGGYELQVTVPVPAEFIRDSKKDNKGNFIRKLHTFLDTRIGKWMGPPAIEGFKDRARSGMLTIKAKWYFDDAFLAYSLGLNLDEWRGSDEVVEKSQIEHRKNLAEKALKELQSFRDIANKKIALRTKDKEEANKIWKEEFMPKWIDLDKKWRERGISYVSLKHSAHEQNVGVRAAALPKSKSCSFVERVEAKYKLVEVLKGIGKGITTALIGLSLFAGSASGAAQLKDPDAAAKKLTVSLNNIDKTFKKLGAGGDCDCGEFQVVTDTEGDTVVFQVTRGGTDVGSLTLDADKEALQVNFGKIGGMGKSYLLMVQNSLNNAYKAETGESLKLYCGSKALSDAENVKTQLELIEYCEK